MKTELEKQLKRYFKDVRGCLLCSTKLSKKFIDDLAQSVDQFVEAQPEADIDAVKKHFGTPEEIAKSFLAETDINVIRKKIRLRRIVAGFLIAVLLIWGIAVGYSAVDSHLSVYGYGEEFIMENATPDESRYESEIIIQGETAP